MFWSSSGWLRCRWEPGMGWSGTSGLRTLKTLSSSSTSPSAPSPLVALRWSFSPTLPPKPPKISGSSAPASTGFYPVLVSLFLVFGMNILFNVYFSWIQYWFPEKLDYPLVTRDANSTGSSKISWFRLVILLRFLQTFFFALFIIKPLYFYFSSEFSSFPGWWQWMRFHLWKQVRGREFYCETHWSWSPVNGMRFSFLMLLPYCYFFFKWISEYILYIFVLTLQLIMLISQMGSTSLNYCFGMFAHMNEN